VLAMMRHFNIPLTRQQYLDLAYMGNPPTVLSAEEVAELPIGFVAVILSALRWATTLDGEFFDENN
jgi:hypothetical protein